MSYQINDEALESLYETVKQDHPELTDDAAIIKARELFWGDKVSASQAQRQLDESSWRCGYDYMTEGALGDF